MKRGGTIKVKRVYEPPEPRDGTRLLVDRLWPRGKKKEALRLAGWPKDVVPSTVLRRWFSHDPRKWQEFQDRYRKELDVRSEAWRPILEAARRGNVTLLYSSRDTEQNNAVALQGYLRAKVRER